MSVFGPYGAAGREDVRVSVVVTCRAGDPAPTLRALAGQDLSILDVLLAGGSAADAATGPSGGPRVAAAEGDPLAIALGAAGGEGSAVVCFVRAGDDLAPAFVRRTLEVLLADGSLRFASCWMASSDPEGRGWTPERLDGATLLGEAVPPPLAVRREALLTLGGGAPLEPGLEEWDLGLRLLDGGARAGLVREPLVTRHASIGPASDEATRHLAAVRGALGRYAAFSRSHLLDAVIHSEGRLLDLVAANFRVESANALELHAEIQRRQLEIERLERRLAAARRS